MDNKINNINNLMRSEETMLVEVFGKLNGCFSE